MTYAEQLNKHLESGGTVIVATHYKAWQYTKKHAGMFFMKGENLYVKQGKSSNCLSFGKDLLVSVRMYN